MNDHQTLRGIRKVEKIAEASKFYRLINNPLRYPEAILFRELVYKKTRKEKEVVAKTFFGATMHLLLPSATDIYLTGGKSHESEVRLAKFLINSLRPGHMFVDIGAHYGYFSLLASKLVEESGSVDAFEAAPTTFEIIKKNTAAISNISIHNKAISDSHGQLKFYEFPNLYSEYSTLVPDQFDKEAWFADYKPKEIDISAISLDNYFADKSGTPDLIKIDVEGAEYKVIVGAKGTLERYNPMIVMEYLSTERSNKEHLAAEKLLNSLSYESFIITADGLPERQDNISDYLKKRGLDSDNVVFIKNL